MSYVSLIDPSGSPEEVQSFFLKALEEAIPPRWKPSITSMEKREIAFILNELIAGWDWDITPSQFIKTVVALKIVASTGPTPEAKTLQKNRVIELTGGLMLVVTSMAGRGLKAVESRLLKSMVSEGGSVFRIAASLEDDPDQKWVLNQTAKRFPEWLLVLDALRQRFAENMLFQDTMEKLCPTGRLVLSGIDITKPPS